MWIAAPWKPMRGGRLGSASRGWWSTSKARNAAARSRSMRAFALRTFVAQLAPALGAQISVEVLTLEPWSARAFTFMRSVEDMLPTGTVLEDGQEVRAELGSGTCSSWALARATFASSATEADATLLHSAYATADSASRCQFGRSSEALASAILVRLSAPAAVPGRLRITVDGSASVVNGGTVVIQQSVDIGADGVLEMSNQYGGVRLEPTLELPVTLGPQPLEIRLVARAAASASNWQTARADLTQRVHFLAGSSASQRIREVGQSCGAQLGGMLLTDLGLLQLDLRVGQAPSTPWSFLVFGTQAANVPIPPTGCVLLQDIVATLPVALQNGAARVVLATPRGPSGPVGDVRVQFLAGVQQGADVHWHMSQGLFLTLP